ncbi:MAG: serine/threonine-protein kinase [Pirellulaceae bacterium]|nr:serine/threonine-protein kinase [Pirellulaceae bacterium]
MPEAATERQLRFGPYVAERELGRGAHGVVYLARHQDRPDARVALKVVENRGNLDKLLLEPEILSKLRHPGIVALEDYFLDGDRLIVALEFIAGEDLKAYAARRGTLPPSEVREFLRQMAAALAHAHAAGVLHRDIKLTNILVAEQAGQPPRFVLTDFGISRIAEGIQVAKHAGGTYLFMAPEQLRGRPEKQSDLWALGVVAYVLLTGRQPFQGGTVAELSQAVQFTVPPPPASIAPSATDEELERLLYGLLEKQVTARTPSADELLKQLGGSAFANAAAITASPAAAITFDERTRTQIARHWRWFWVSAALLTGLYGLVPQLLVLSGAFLFYRGQSATLAVRQWLFSLAGLALMGAGTLVSLVWPYVILFGMAAVGAPGDLAVITLIAMTLLAVVCGLTFPYLAFYHFGQAHRLEREINLRRAVTGSTLAPSEFLALLRGFLDQQTEDVRLHQRYVEALLAHGHPDEAAVEARLLLENDPYDFTASLQLAQAYFDLRLYRLCQKVCDEYLAVAGYSFEFADLKQQCVQT